MEGKSNKTSRSGYLTTASVPPLENDRIEMSIACTKVFNYTMERNGVKEDEAELMRLLQARRDSFGDIFERRIKEAVMDRRLRPPKYDMDLSFTEFLKLSNTFFDRYYNNPSKMDWYFGLYTPLWSYCMDKWLYEDAKWVWMGLALNTANSWQRLEGKEMHKGTPFYFLAGTEITAGDLEHGFLQMHNALEEDMKWLAKNGKLDTPSYRFLTLSEKPDDRQYFKRRIEEVIDFLDDRLDNYRSMLGQSLGYDDFRSRFLLSSELTEEVFLFTSCIFRAHYLLERFEKTWRQSAYAAILESRLIFELCLVFDNLLGCLLKKKTGVDPSWKFTEKIDVLSRETGLGLSLDEIREMSTCFNIDFRATMKAIRSGNYTTGTGMSLTGIERDLGISLGFRNYGAHVIESENSVREDFSELLQHVLNSVFFAVEKLV